MFARAPLLLAVVVCFAAVLAASGCSQFRLASAPVQNARVEPKSGGRYFLSRPTGYDRRYGWPLVVVCHSRRGDSAEKQLAEWADLAERRGLIVVAPEFEFGSRSRWADEVIVQGEQLAFAKQVVDTVEHVRAGQNVSEDRILIYGYGWGAEPALAAGLSRPDVFRAISLNQPVVAGDRLPGNWTQVDPHQPVHVRFNNADRLFARRYKALTQWLRLMGADVRHDWGGAADRDPAGRAVAFFELLLRKEPWLRVDVHRPDPQDPFVVQYRLKSSFEPDRVRWEFGDGEHAYASEPTHAYGEPGTYEIRVEAVDDRGETFARRRWLSLPDGVLTPRRPL